MLFRKLLSLFAPGGLHDHSPGVEKTLPAEEALISTLVGFINRTDLISEELKERDRARSTYDSLEKELAYAKAYLKLERFVLANKPLVTKREVGDAAALRANVRRHGYVRDLSDPVRLLFLSEGKQVALLSRLALVDLVQYIRRNLGDAELAKAFHSGVEGGLLEKTDIRADSLDLSSVLDSLDSVPLSEVKVAFRRLFGALFSSVAHVLGEQSANNIAQAVYERVAQNYSQELLGLFLEVIPDGFLESQKLFVLSREALESRVVEATAALVKEKESVERKVAERTEELRVKVEELSTSNTLLKKREQDLKLANARLTELDKVKTEFISVAAHQLRTPLSAIKWTLEFLVDSGENLTPEQKSRLLKASESNERLISLVSDMLVVTRIESGKVQYNLTQFHIEDLIDSVLLDFAASARARKVDLTFQRPESVIPYVRADSEKIRAVLQNLFENALSYTKEGGTITVSSRQENEFVKVSVRDSGIGIPLRQQSAIFNKFFRADNALKEKTDGSGLGLFVAKNIVETHGGAISFESQEGQGTTFYFTIPLASKDPGERGGSV